MERLQQVRGALLRADQAEQVVEELAHAVEHGRASRPQREQTFRPELVHVRHALLSALLDLLESRRVLGQQFTQPLLHLRGFGGVEQVLLDGTMGRRLIEHGEEVMQRLVPRRTHRVAGVHGDLDQTLGLVLVHRELARRADVCELGKRHLHVLAANAGDLVKDRLLIDFAGPPTLGFHVRILPDGLDIVVIKDDEVSPAAPTLRGLRVMHRPRNTDLTEEVRGLVLPTKPSGQRCVQLPTSDGFGGVDHVVHEAAHASLLVVRGSEGPKTSIPALKDVALRGFRQPAREN